MTNRPQDLNKQTYEQFYQTKQQAFLRYPADWVIRFHNIYLREHLPTGRILDYGCGSGNNSIFFLRNGYDVHGVDVAESALDLVELNLKSYNLDPEYINSFQTVPLDWTRLPYEDCFFDFILSNQVLYYLPSEDEIQRVCQELSRCLKPGGAVFFTMIGPTNYQIRSQGAQVLDGKVYEVRFKDPSHRLYEQHEMNYLVQDEDELKSLFSEFECITTGYFDQKMFDLTSNFHWIFAGKKPS